MAKKKESAQTTVRRMRRKTRKKLTCPVTYTRRKVAKRVEQDQVITIHNVRLT